MISSRHLYDLDITVALTFGRVRLYSKSECKSRGCPYTIRQIHIAPEDKDFQLRPHSFLCWCAIIEPMGSLEILQVDRGVNTSQKNARSFECVEVGDRFEFLLCNGLERGSCLLDVKGDLG